MKKRIIITSVLSIAIIFALLWIANPEELLDSFSKVNFYFIIIVIFLYFLNLIAKSFRWYLLVNSTGSKVQYKKTFPFYIIGLAFNNLTPGKIGGEPVRAYLLNKEAQVPIGQGMASIFIEKIMDIIVIASMAVVGAIFILPHLTPDAARILIVILVGVIAAIIVAVVIVSHSTLLERTVDRSMNFAMKVSKRSFLRRLSSALAGFLDRFRFGMGEIMKAKGRAGICIVLTVIIWVNEAVRLFIILLAIPDIEGVSLGSVFIASSIANILALALPVGAGNLLGIESVFIAVGMAPSDAGAAGILHIATSLWISVPLGAIAMFILGFRISKLSNLTKNGTDPEIAEGDLNSNRKAQPAGEKKSTMRNGENTQTKLKRTGKNDTPRSIRIKPQ